MMQFVIPGEWNEIFSRIYADELTRAAKWKNETDDDVRNDGYLHCV